MCTINRLYEASVCSTWTVQCVLNINFPKNCMYITHIKFFYPLPLPALTLIIVLAFASFDNSFTPHVLILCFLTCLPIAMPSAIYPYSPLWLPSSSRAYPSHSLHHLTYVRVHPNKSSTMMPSKLTPSIGFGFGLIILLRYFFWYLNFFSQSRSSKLDYTHQWLLGKIFV